MRDMHIRIIALAKYVAARHLIQSALARTTIASDVPGYLRSQGSGAIPEEFSGMRQASGFDDRVVNWGELSPTAYVLRRRRLSVRDATAVARRLVPD
jgi:hypothetical protein